MTSSLWTPRKLSALERDPNFMLDSFWMQDSQAVVTTREEIRFLMPRSCALLLGIPEIMQPPMQPHVQPPMQLQSVRSTPLIHDTVDGRLFTAQDTFLFASAKAAHFIDTHFPGRIYGLAEPWLLATASGVPVAALPLLSVTSRKDFFNEHP